MIIQETCFFLCAENLLPPIKIIIIVKYRKIRYFLIWRKENGQKRREKIIAAFGAQLFFGGVLSGDSPFWEISERRKNADARGGLCGKPRCCFPIFLLRKKMFVKSYVSSKISLLIFLSQNIVKTWVNDQNWLDELNFLFLSLSHFLKT